MMWRGLPLILLLLSCGPSVADQPPLAGTRIGGPFSLVDQNGQRRTDRDYAGKYRIMYFGYTSCPDVCPTDVAHLTAGYRAFEKQYPVRAARVVPIFVTVDPDRDTAPVLKQFTAAFDPALVGLGGSRVEIASVAKAYGVTYRIDKTNGGDHSRNAYLMDGDGKPLALLSQDAPPAVIAGELDKWVR